MAVVVVNPECRFLFRMETSEAEMRGFVNGIVPEWFKQFCAGELAAMDRHTLMLPETKKTRQRKRA